MILQHLPLQKEALDQVKDQMPTEAMVQIQVENKHKALNNEVVRTLNEILLSCLAVDQYGGTQIQCSFQIIEIDADLIMSLVNAMSATLLASPFKCRFLPVCIFVLVDKEDNFVVDPTAD